MSTLQKELEQCKKDLDYYSNKIQALIFEREKLEKEIEKKKKEENDWFTSGEWFEKTDIEKDIKFVVARTLCDKFAVIGFDVYGDAYICFGGIKQGKDGKINLKENYSWANGIRRISRPF